LGVPPPKPNVRNSATANRYIQIRLNGRRALMPAARYRIRRDRTPPTEPFPPPPTACWFSTPLLTALFEPVCLDQGRSLTAFVR
jgi:hypothetical protein